jgi:hypothetical protein
VPLPLHFPQNVDSVVISERPRHLVVVHGQVVLLDAPQLGQARGVHDLEDAGLLVLPGNVVGVPLTLKEVSNQLCRGLRTFLLINRWHYYIHNFNSNFKRKVIRTPTEVMKLDQRNPPCKMQAHLIYQNVAIKLVNYFCLKNTQRQTLDISGLCYFYLKVYLHSPDTY